MRDTGKTKFALPPRQGLEVVLSLEYGFSIIFMCPICTNLLVTKWNSRIDNYYNYN